MRLIDILSNVNVLFQLAALTGSRSWEFLMNIPRILFEDKNILYMFLVYFQIFLSYEVPQGVCSVLIKHIINKLSLNIHTYVYLIVILMKGH